MSRPKKPKKVLELVGAYKKNPQRREENTLSDDRDIAPPNLSGLELECWKEIMSSSVQGVLCKSDSIAVELAARLLSQFRVAAEEMPSSKIGQLITLLSKFGMTPSDRRNVNMPETQKEPSGFSNFA